MRTLQLIAQGIEDLKQRGEEMSAALDRLTAEVAETTAAVDAVLTLVDGLAQQIRDNATDPVALNALADELDAQQARIAAAVVANTAAEDDEDEGEEPEPGTGN